MIAKPVVEPFLMLFRCSSPRTASWACETTGDHEVLAEPIFRTADDLVVSWGTRHTSVNQETTDDT